MAWLESRFASGDASESAFHSSAMGMLMAVMLWVASIVSAAETGALQAQSASPPFFLDLAQASGLKFQHFNGMTGRFYIRR